MSKKLFFLIIFFLNFNLCAQFLPLRVYTSADGLASNQVLEIKSDKNGALWIGCGSGLSYFTGFKFVNYGLKEGLPDITIEKIKPVENGVFVLTYHGLSFKKDSEDYFRKINIPGEIRDFTVSKIDGKVIILSCVKGKGLVLNPFAAVNEERILFSCVDPNSVEVFGGKVIFTRSNGDLYVINPENGKATKLKHFSYPVKLKAKGNQLLAIGEKGVYKFVYFNKDIFLRELYKSRDDTLFIFDAEVDFSNNLWIGTNKYLMYFSKKNKHYYSTNDGLPELPVFSVFQNKDGIMWFGTNSGLAKLVNNEMIIFKKLKNEDIKSCISLYWDKKEKKMWAGINRGVAVIKGNKIVRFKNKFLDQYVIWAIARDQNGNYYFATEGGGVVKISKEGKTTMFRRENGCLPDNRITDLLFLNNTLYVSTKNGFAFLRDGKWYKFTSENGLPASYIRALTHDEKGNIYLATYGAGIVMFKNNNFVQIIKNLKSEYSTIYALAYKNGVFWACCSYGLIKVKDGIATLYGERNGFPNYSGVAVLPLENYVWVGTDGGACIFDIKREVVVEIFTKDEGLPGNEFTTHNAICKDPDGNVWMGVFGGIARLNEKTIEKEEKKFDPVVILKKITYYNHNQRWVIGGSVKKLTIPYGAKDISFYFDVIWFKNEFSTALFYKLEGENRDWERIDNLRNTKVHFNFLTYGEYKLLLKIVNLSGKNVAVKKEIIQLTVLKPWWAKKWVIFSLFVLFLLGGAVFTMIITHFKTQHLIMEKTRLDKLVAEKTEQLRKANLLLKEKNKMLAELAERDYLTNLYNRRHAMKVIKLYQKLADRDKNFKISFILIDIDFFKVINDTYGHDAGDFILKQLAILLKKNTRKSDIIARWGGEEFLIILPKTNLEQARIVAEKLRKEVEASEFFFNGKIIKFTISAGVACLDLGESYSDEDIERVLKKVDIKLYEAKQSGRNLIVC